jgi:DNA-binding response OmpR family regulator
MEIVPGNSHPTFEKREVPMNKIIVFDAHPAIRELLSEDLTAEGNVVMAIGRHDFLRDSVATFHPDLLIMDLNIWGETRWDLLASLRSRYPAIPILIFTACLPQEDFRTSLADGWIQKSFLSDELKEKINEILGKPLDNRWGNPMHEGEFGRPKTNGAQTRLGRLN